MTSWYGRDAKAFIAGACLLWLASLFALPVRAAAGTDGPPAFKAEEIEALVAPIALYPDPLLSQVLMASTYPLEIVHAARWSKENPSLRGDAAVNAVENMSWDASVKSLVAFPQILEPMNDKLDWTQRLGDAFLAQPADVFAAVQRLRGRAQAAGNLQSNAQQTVTVEPASAGQGQVVRIEPAQPEVIYVPAYNPTVIYGTWGSPSYPPTYWPPSPAYYAGSALVSGFAWGVGLAAAGAIFSDCNWGGGDVDIDYNKVTNIDRNFDRSKVQGQGGRWQHNPAHRQGVAYRDNATRQQYAAGVPGADRRAEYRGRDMGGGANQATVDRGAGGRAAGTGRAADGNRAGAAERAGAADRGGAANRASSTARPTAGNRAPGTGSSAAPNRTSPTAPGRDGAASRGTNANTAQGGNVRRATSGGAAGTGRDSAFTGVGGSGAAAQRSYDRGRASQQGAGMNRAGRGGGSGGRR